MKFSLSVIGVCLATVLVACGGGDPPDTNKKLVTSAAITTFAGSGQYEYKDGTGTAAAFIYPYGVAINSNGDLYVTDKGTIRKVTSAGEVSLFATLVGTAWGVAVGSDGNVYVSLISPTNIGEIYKFDPQTGSRILIAGGVGTFGSPQGLALDSDNNVYVADSANNVIRKITSSGVITFAGSGVAGSSDGNTTNASFSNPKGVAVDASNNVYVADFNNSLIRKISPNGDVTTLAGHIGGLSSDSGDGTGAEASFISPAGVAVDRLGNVYVADTGNHKIRKITSAGMVTTLAGSGAPAKAEGIGYRAQFNLPTSIAVGTGGIFYIADSQNRVIRQMTITTQ